jgi:hypothetical protein
MLLSIPATAFAENDLALEKENPAVTKDAAERENTVSIYEAQI